MFALPPAVVTDVTPFANGTGLSERCDDLLAAFAFASSAPPGGAVSVSGPNAPNVSTAALTLVFVPCVTLTVAVDPTPIAFAEPLTVAVVAPSVCTVTARASMVGSVATSGAVMIATPVSFAT